MRWAIIRSEWVAKFRLGIYIVGQTGGYVNEVGAALWGQLLMSRYLLQCLHLERNSVRLFSVDWLSEYIMCIFSVMHRLQRFVLGE